MTGCGVTKDGLTGATVKVRLPLIARVRTYEVTQGQGDILGGADPAKGTRSAHTAGLWPCGAV